MRADSRPIMTAQALSLLEDDVRAVFAFEAAELLHRAEQSLRTLSALPASSPTSLFAAHQGELLRRLHSLKGAASAASQHELRDRVHALESRLGEISIDDRAALLSLLRDGLSSLRQQLGRAEDDEVVPSTLPPRSFAGALNGAVLAAARECGKNVRLVVNVDEITARSGLLGRLYEPLLHLLRNAVAHGIEAPSRRTLLGKSAIGTVLLQARAQNGRCTLRVIDDGMGLDLEAVAARAAQRGLWQQDASIDVPQALDLMCRPGFSTRDRSDELAGRGMGLHVVKIAAQTLCGALLVHSVRGAGCAFTLEFPLEA